MTEFTFIIDIGKGYENCLIFKQRNLIFYISPTSLEWVKDSLTVLDFCLNF